ncbi:MAG: AI-2E family transporter [Clostridiales bacterium]|nr:AI-2E family transporter [Clostridiales bacterium]MDD7386404.1 AI-2E family transporter [Bacillota bacterium]
MIAPFAIGAVLAFILNVPMRGIERGLKLIRKPGLRRILAVLLTFIFLLLVLTGVVCLLVPQITETIESLIPKLVTFFQGIDRGVRDFFTDNPEIWNFVAANTDIETFDWAAIDWPALVQKVMNMLSSSVTVIANSAFSAVGSITGAIVNAVIGLVFAVYCLSRKEILARQGRRMVYAVLPERFCDELIRILRLTNSTFSNFISGQCLEACILGCLFAVTMAILRMPFIPLVSVLIAVTALIPVVGAFVGCVLGAFFILVNDPIQAIIFVAMFLILQQIENNMIYPKVVGTSIGLPGMWVLVAVSVGGEIMGVGGMFIMIPIAAVLYTLAREFTSKRVAQRGIDPDKLRDHPPELKSKFKEKREKKREQRLLRQMKELAEKHAHVNHEKNESK